MIRSQVALIQREFWEHRSIYVAPIVLALIIALMSVTGQVSISTEHVDIALLSLSNLGDSARATALTAMMLAVFMLFFLGMSVLAIFYSLDSLYAERKDKSILFWRSIPVTDAETVVSKLLTAVLVIPLVTFVAVVLTHLLVGIITSIWVAARGANAWHLIWQSAPLFDTWAAMLIMLLGASLWMSPFVGWFLLVSAYTKRSPFLVGFLPIVVLPMLEKSLIGTELFKDAIFVRTANYPLFKDLDTLERMVEDESLHSLAEADVSVMSLLDLGRFIGSPALWGGLIVCAIFVTAAIYVRRYRDES